MLRVLVVLGVLGVVRARDVVPFDFAWRFSASPDCRSAFRNASGVQCLGLTHYEGGDPSPESCEVQCCATKCITWQWSPTEGCWGGVCAKPPFKNPEWVGGAALQSTPPPATAEYNDSTWEVVDVPHDFIISQQYNRSTPGSGQSYLPRKNAWYRKHFVPPPGWSGDRVYLYFEGVFRTCSVYLNGKLVSSHGSGYTSFTVPLEALLPTAPNVLAVAVDGSVGSGWWYEGAGIYRHVHLIRTSRTAFDVDGVFTESEVHGIHARATASQGVWAEQAVVKVNASVVGESPCTVRATLTASSGQVVAHTTVPREGPTAHLTLNITNAELWSIPRPHLYSLLLELVAGSSVYDSVNVSIGLRTIEYTGDQGFFLNGQHVKVRGFCDHNDFAAVGMAVPDRIKLFRAQTLRGVGGNGRRMSHNPPEPAMLDIYDRLGVVVMDENRQFGDNEAWVDNMGEMVKRDRNHPSIVIWSYCNEGGCGGSPTTGASYRNVTYFYDGTRPTLGNHVGNKDLNRYMDVQGFSHRSGHDFDAYHSANPSKPTYASECCSCESNRGEDVGNSTTRMLPSFNADCVRGQTNASDGRGYMVGTMVWTLLDYYGESHGWPHVISSFGQFDVAGFPKAAAYWYRTWWLAASPENTPDRPPVGPAPQVHIVEHWEEDGGEGKRKVHAYTNGHQVELFVNGVSAGRQPIAELGYAVWEVEYAQGELRAVAYDSESKKIGEHVVRTSGSAVRLALTIDAPSPATGTGKALLLDGQDVALLRGAVLDQNGNIVHRAQNPVTFRVVTGPGRVIGSHNGDVTNHELNHSPTHAAYHGLVRGVVQVTECRVPKCEHLASVDLDGSRRTRIFSGHDRQSALSPIVVEITSPGLAAATVSIPVSTDPSDDVLHSALASVATANFN